MTNDVNVYELDIPGPTHEMVTENADGSYSIFLNARLSDEAQHEAFEHAMYHITHNDFERKEEDIQLIELSAHGMEN